MVDLGRLMWGTIRCIAVANVPLSKLWMLSAQTALGGPKGLRHEKKGELSQRGLTHIPQRV
jgi:hypothetical protein